MHVWCHQFVPHSLLCPALFAFCIWLWISIENPQVEAAVEEKAASDIRGFTKIGYLPWNLIRGFTVFTEKREKARSEHRRSQGVCACVWRHMLRLTDKRLFSLLSKRKQFLTRVSAGQFWSTLSEDRVNTGFQSHSWHSSHLFVIIYTTSGEGGWGGPW